MTTVMDLSSSAANTHSHENNAQSRVALTENAIMRMRQILAEEGASGLTILVDPALDDSIRPLCSEANLTVRTMDIHHPDLSDEMKPFLVPIKNEEAQERFVNETIRRAIGQNIAARDNWPTPRSVCAWILLSEEQCNEFAKCFAARALVQPPTVSDRKKLLRFWDPRVLPHLNRIIGGDTWLHWLNTDLTWLYLNEWGHLKLHRFRKPVTPIDPYWQPNIESWQALERIAEINHCLTVSGLLHHQPNDNAPLQFERLLMQATRLNCAEPIDRVTYAVLCDSMGHAIEKHPQISSIFSRVSQEETSFSDLVSEFEQADWDRICSDLAHDNSSKNSSIPLQRKS